MPSPTTATRKPAKAPSLDLSFATLQPVLAELRVSGERLRKFRADMLDLDAQLWRAERIGLPAVAAKRADLRQARYTGSDRTAEQIDAELDALDRDEDALRQLLGRERPAFERGGAVETTGDRLAGEHRQAIERFRAAFRQSLDDVFAAMHTAIREATADLAALHAAATALSTDGARSAIDWTKVATVPDPATARYAYSPGADRLAHDGPGLLAEPGDTALADAVRQAVGPLQAALREAGIVGVGTSMAELLSQARRDYRTPEQEAAVEARRRANVKAQAEREESERREREREAAQPKFQPSRHRFGGMPVPQPAVVSSVLADD